jgi:hypothetical protein
MKSLINFALAAAFIFLGISTAQAFDMPLYDKYLNTPNEELKNETSQMGRDLRSTFNESSIQRSQQRIDFADYYANFKKLVLYGGKLANYADYEENLSFARDRDLFRGLSSVESRNGESAGGNYDRNAFVNQKHETMKVNVIQEIETYTDLIIISLNACEIISANDLSGFSTARESKDTILRYMDESQAYQVYESQFNRLESSWPDLARRISNQIAFWEAQGRRMPGVPIIDPLVTGAIL